MFERIIPRSMPKIIKENFCISYEAGHNLFSNHRLHRFSPDFFSILNANYTNKHENFVTTTTSSPPYQVRDRPSPYPSLSKREESIYILSTILQEKISLKFRKPVFQYCPAHLFHQLSIEEKIMIGIKPQT